MVSMAVRFCGLLALLAGCAAAQACEGDERPIFRCEAADGRKFIALCASAAGQDEPYLQYRFGALSPAGEMLELEFPRERAGSMARFQGAVYTHRGVYEQSVRFVSGGFSYTVFTRAKGREDLGAGVAVRNLRSGKATTVACSERPRFYIFELQGLLACDPQTPAGTACIR